MKNLIGMRLAAAALAALAATGLSAADIYVSLSTGKNKNAGTKEAPLKNLWKALEKAETGDVIHLAEGNYPGKMKSGWFMMTKPVSIVGGYSADFAARDPLVHRTLFQPANENNDKKGSGRGILHLEFEKSPAKAPKGFKMKLDGLIFDDGFASSYHAVKGKPEGFDTGMWLQGPAKNPADKCVSADRYSIYSATASRAEGDIEIENCVFVNGSNMGVNLNWWKGEVEIENCVFVNNRLIGANVNCTNPKPAVKWEFKHNTVLFTWTTKNDLQGMGYGVRTNTKVESEIEDNVIGLNVMSGLDNTMGNPKDKKIKIDGNVFFLNRESDVHPGKGAQALEFLVAQLDSIPWSGSVALAKPDRLIINRGTRDGVAVGMQFDVGKVEEVVDEDTGEVIDSSMTKLGTVSVTEVKEKVSYTTPLAGAEKGMGVHPAQ